MYREGRLFDASPKCLNYVRGRYLFLQKSDSWHVHGSQTEELRSPAPLLKTRIVGMLIDYSSVRGLITIRFVATMLFSQGFPL